jgi:hypothetical protein
VDGSIWNVLKTDPTGTGVYKPFLGLQAGRTGVQIGLNTDETAQVYDDTRQNTDFTRAVLWSELDHQDGFYVFTFDLDEPLNGKDDWLSIDVLRLYSGADAMANSITGLDKNWELDCTVLMDQNLSSSGNGADDVLVKIPYFVPTDEWMYLYVEMGKTDLEDGRNFGGANGFEEVRARLGSTQVPEPATLILLGLGLLGIAGIRRKK